MQLRCPHVIIKMEEAYFKYWAEEDKNFAQGV